MSTFVRTYKRRKIFLDQLAAGSSLSFAARAAGGVPRQFKRWREEDENFAADWDEALEEGTDFIEDIATQRAIKKSDTLMVMMLKARRPDKYDRAGKLELSGGISVEGSKAKLLNRIAKLQAISSSVQQEGPATEQEVLPEPEEVPALPAPEAVGDGVPVRGRKRRRATEGSGRAKAA